MIYTAAVTTVRRPWQALDRGATIVHAPALKVRWQALDRSSRLTLAGLVVLVTGAVGVRMWLMLAYPPAFLGFPDSSQYALAAASNIFRDAQRPAGYPFFLRLVHHLSSDLSFVIVVQHVLGVATGLLLYKAVRRTGAPPWLGLWPAAVVFFGATGLLLEHALLADSLFAFLQAVGVYATIRALYDTSLRWPLLAGVAIGLSFWVKTVAISSGVLVAILLLCGAPGGVRRKLVSAATVSLVVTALILVYVGSQYYFTGYLGYERQSAWDAYGRVATFVNCSAFTPPRGTSFLCPREPVGHRQSQDFFQYANTAPAVERFGPPYAAPLYANGLLKAFSTAAIEHEPVAYAGAIIRGLSRYVYPRVGEGYTPENVRLEVTKPANERSYQPAFALFYRESLGYIGPSPGAQPLSVYERYTLVQGPLLILMLVAAIAGPFILPGGMRWAAATFTLTALVTITFAVAGNGYDARYAYPTFGPLAAGAALGAWEIGSFLVRVLRRRGTRQQPATVRP